MAYLNGQLTTLVAAGWSDATGFADNATLEIRDGQQTITGGLDNSGLTEGITSLDIGPGFSGTIGGTAGPLKVDVDGSGTPQLRYAASGGALYYQAAGDDNLCARFVNSSAGRAYLVGGTFTVLELNSGYTQVSDAVTVSSSTVYMTGGTHDFDTAIGTLHQFGGNVIARKGVTTWTQYGGSGIHDSLSGNITTFTQSPGATMDHRGGNIATAVIAGNFTVERATRSGTIGGTSALLSLSTARIVDTSPTAGITWSNVTKLGKGTGTAVSGGGPI